MTLICKRSLSRIMIAQALYEMDIARKSLRDVITEFESHWSVQELEGVQYHAFDRHFFKSIVRGVVQHQEESDGLLIAHLPEAWPLERIELMLRAILRAGIYELMKRPDIPKWVVVKEYTDVTAAFFGNQEVGMVNALLDKLARYLRPEPVADTHSLSELSAEPIDSLAPTQEEQKEEIYDTPYFL